MTTRHLIIPGMAKAGTTFLFDQLTRDSEVFNLPKFKELNYLHKDPRRMSIKGYLELFPGHRPDRIFLDASPPYLQATSPIADTVKTVLADRDVKFIITLRDPVWTMWSHYLHDLKSTICPIGRKPNLRSFSLFEPGVLKRYFKNRHRHVSALCKSFPGQVMGLHMKSLFQPGTAESIGRFLGETVTPFRSEKVSNPGGWLPYFRYGGRQGQEFVQGDTVYALPPRALLLVSNDRSELSLDVSPAEAGRCMALQATFVRNLDVPFSFFEPIIEDYQATCTVLGLAPEPIEEPDRVVSEATVPVVPEAICARLDRTGTLQDRTRQVFGQAS